jgi:hypothetical protein
MQHGKPQLVEIKKNRTVLFSKIVRIDDALPPVVNLASFINYIKPNQIKFEAYFANSFCNKKLFRIFINNEEIDFTYTISNNIVTANFNNNININTVEVYVYNSKGDYVFEKIEL